MVSYLRAAPTVPSSCENCPIRQSTICEPFATRDQLGVVENFKSGDRVIAAGVDLFRMGDPPPDLYNLLDGWVALYQISHSGRRQILDFILPGAFLGYQPDLFKPMSYGAVCLTDVSVCVFPRQGFPQLLSSQPDLGLKLARLSSESAVQAYENLTNIGCRPAQARIAHLLLSLYTRVRQTDQLTPLVETEIPLTQGDIADALGLTNVYVSQALRQLKEKNLLIFKDGRLQILDPAGLANVADFDQLLVVAG